MSITGVAPARPHPASALLTSLQRARVYIDVAVIVVVLALTNLVAHFTTPRANVVTAPPLTSAPAAASRSAR